MIKRLSGILIISAMLTACSNVKPYDSTYKKNLYINSKTDDDVNAAIDIYHVNNSCKYDYKGTVTLKDGKNRIGLKENQANYLVVSFTTSSFWASSTSSMSQDMTIKPNKKYSYKLNLSYMDDIYNIELKKTHLKSKRTSIVITENSMCNNR